MTALWAVLAGLAIFVGVLTLTTLMPDRPPFTTHPVQSGMLVGAGCFCAFSVPALGVGLAAPESGNWTMVMLYEVLAGGMSFVTGLLTVSWLANAERRQSAEVPLWLRFDMVKDVLESFSGLFLGVAVLVLLNGSRGRFFDGLVAFLALLTIVLTMSSLQPPSHLSALPPRMIRGILALDACAVWIGVLTLIFEAALFVSTAVSSVFPVAFGVVVGGAALLVLLAAWFALDPRARIGTGA